MALPSYRDSLGSPEIGPGITVLRGGIFDEPADGTILTIDAMNRELKDLSSIDPIVFEHDDPLPDHLLSQFMQERTHKS